jgi:hypothetical protein
VKGGQGVYGTLQSFFSSGALQLNPLRATFCPDIDMCALLCSGMTTLDPRAGEPRSACTWDASKEDASWREQYTGECGTAPLAVPQLPSIVCAP